MNRTVRVLAFALTLSVVVLLPAGRAGGGPQKYAPGGGGDRKLRVEDPATAAALVEGGARLVADYGTFQVFAASESASALVGPGVEDRTHENRILLHAGAVDTKDAATRGARARTAAFPGKRLHLVQFEGPVKPDWFAALKKTGAQVVEYIPNNAYLVYGDSAALASVQSLPARVPALQFEGAFTDNDKVHPRVRALQKGRAETNWLGHFQIQLVADPAANAATLGVIDALKTGPILRTNAVGPYVTVIVALPKDAVDGLAAQPDVLSIRPYIVPRKRDERQNQIIAGNLSGNNPSGPGYLAWLTSKGFSQAQFDASGLVVDVTDSGVDNANTNAPNHFALRRTGNLSLASRLSYARLEGSPNTGSTIQGCDGHGTINAHIIGGYSTMTNFPHTDAAGYRYGLGVAPFVKVGSSVIFDPANFTNPDYEDLISRAYRDGARVSGNSWGADTAGGYDTDAQAYDFLVRDAQPTASAVPNAGNQQMTIVFANGNAGSGAGTVGSPATAKNVISVGAAENVHAFGGADGCGTTDTEANSANDMADFSSRGPCDDGRIKPEIVAPGTHVSGGVSQSAASTNGNGAALACFAGEGVCGGAGSNFHPAGQQFYTASSGTSHSTPALAGGAALVHQWFINNYATPPSPAMVKAFLVNAARYMNGTGANDTLPSNSQGMGMMNLGTAFDGTQRILRDQVTNDIFTASGQSRTLTGTIVSNSKPVRVTLTWTDAPGSTAGNAYRNDLNLVVIVNGVTYRGNVFSGANSIAGGSADIRNNSESVFLPAGTTGSVAITVSAANINSDGVPNFGTSLDQDYALVAYNITETQTPVISAAGSAIIAESCGIGNGAVDPDEIVTVRFALRNVGSADTTNVVATLQATGGVTAPTAPQSYGALLAGGATFTNAFTFTATGTCGGTVTATLSLQDGTNNLGAIAFAFPIGGTSAGTSTFANASTITINDNTTASPYPSTINVSGLAGSVSKVVVELLGFSHTYPSDVDVVLVGPGGEKVALMGGVGGGTPASAANLTFDDAAAGQIATVTTGAYQPSGSVSSMPSPAPAGPYASSLSAFNATSGNGTWSLYVADAAAADVGSIAQGWRLRITAGEPICCASNQPPILSAIGNKTITASNTLTFTVSAVDPYDGDIVTLSASNPPGDATFLTVSNAPSVTNTFLWTNALPIGVYTTTFYAVDKDGVDTETITISVVEGGGITNYIVNFEGAGETKTSYASGNVTLSGRSWNLTDALIGTAANDRKNGIRSARIQNSGTLTMQADITGGVGVVSFLYAAYGSDASSSLALDYSADGGSVWVNAGTVTVSSTTLQTYSANISQNGNVRLRIRKTSGGGARANVDDILTTAFGGPAPQSPPVLAAIGPKNVAVSNLLQFTVAATPTDGDTVTLTASNLPFGATFAATNENGSFIWTNAAPVGVYTADFYAVDNDGVDSESVIITVNEQAPASTNFIVEYSFEDNALVFTRAANAVAAGLSAGLFDSADSSTTNFGGNPTWSIADSGFTGANYFHFTLTAGSGLTAVVTRVAFDDQRSNTGPSTWNLRSSLDGYAADLASGGSHASFATNEAAISVAITGSVTFRITGAGGTAGGTWRVDNVRLLGATQGGGSPDAPSITVTTAPQAVSNPTTSIAVGGSANTNVVGEIAWTNALTGGAGTIPAATNWLIASVPLNVGANVITVRGTNGTGASASASVTISRQSAGGGGSLTNILFQGFEPGDGWTITTGAANISTTTGGADTPANQRIRTGTNSWQVSNASASLDLASAAIAGFTQRQARVHVSSTSSTSGNGVEPADVVRVFVALDGAAFSATPDIVLAGNNNARWGFGATNFLQTTAGTIVSNQTPSGGTITNAYARLLVNLPESATSVALRVTAVNNQAEERWNIDDVTVVGYGVGGPTDISPLLVITTAPQTVAFGVAGIDVGGTSTNLAGHIRWTNGLSGAAGSIAAANPWLIPGVGLAIGTNAITVFGSNVIGVATSATVAIARESNDTDTDGIDDAWEQFYFGSLTNVSASSDWDGDFFIDVHEFLAGTSPVNSNSLFIATDTRPDVTATSVVVRWASASNRFYSVTRASDPLAVYSVLESNIAANPPTNTFVDGTATNPSAIYRVLLEVQ